jgi:hypothetical protein
MRAEPDSLPLMESVGDILWLLAGRDVVDAEREQFLPRLNGLCSQFLFLGTQLTKLALARKGAELGLQRCFKSFVCK